MFITAMAANPLAVNLAAAAGIDISWGTWALAGLVPGLVCLVLVPLILYVLYPPEVSLLEAFTTLFACLHVYCLGLACFTHYTRSSGKGVQEEQGSDSGDVALAAPLALPN